jgi:hypothetical protein
MLASGGMEPGLVQVELAADVEAALPVAERRAIR